LTVLSDGVKQNLTNRGIAPEKIEVVHNWCDETSIRVDTSDGSPINRPDFAGKFVVLFAGTMGFAQGLDTVLACAKISKELLPAVQFVLIGGGVERQRLQKRAQEMSLDNVTFLPPRAMEAMGEVFALADVLLVHLKDDPLFRITIPSKTQAYLYMGKPIIMAMRGDAASLVQQAGAGLLCNPENPDAMMKAIKSLYEMKPRQREKLGKAGHLYYMHYLSFNQGVLKFEKIMMLLSGKTA